MPVHYVWVTDMPHADQVRTRIRFRPGWSPGRRSYAWLLPLGDRPGPRDLANQYQYALLDLPGFDLVPLEWMHILVQEIGFTDELDRDRLTTVIERTTNRLATMAPLTLAFERAVVLPESLALPAEPQSALRELRTILRAATAEGLDSDPDSLPPEPELSDQHASLGYPTMDGPSIVAVATLNAIPVEPTTAKIPAAHLVELNRDHASCEWETVARVPFGG